MNAQSEQEPVNHGHLTLHMSSAIGALFLGIGDYLTHSHDSLTMKMGEMVLPGNNYPPMGLLVLMFLGYIASWVHPAGTKANSFKGGAAVLGLIMGLVPQGEPIAAHNLKSTSDTQTPRNISDNGKQPSLTGLFLIREANADEVNNGVKRGAGVDGTQKTDLQKEVILRDRNDPQKKVDAFLLLRDGQKMKIIDKGHVNGGVAIQQSPGSYFLDIEADGYRNIRYPIEIKSSGTNPTGGADVENNPIVIDLEKSNVPLFLQRLTPPVSVNSNSLQRPLQ